MIITSVYLNPDAMAGVHEEKNGTNMMKLKYADEPADVKCVYKVPV